MLSEADNRLLTEVGPGTPMGELLRRYWMPIAAVAELDETPTKQVRLMGEDLALYKDKSGNYGLMDLHCPHRRADMTYGMIEEHGLRCNYHGWLFDETGACTQMPFEDMAHPDAKFRERIHIKAYPVEAKAGLLWAYLGPLPAPLVPTWEPFTWDNGFVQVVFAEMPCNWLQCQENSIDPVHFEWLHSNWSKRLNDVDGYSPTHLRVGFDEFEHGFIYRRILEGGSEADSIWQVGRVCLWPNALFTGEHFEWRVPIDDGRTLSVTWAFNPVPLDRQPYKQERIPYWYGPIKEPETGRWITTHVMNQDFVAWVGQGEIADRTQEHLGESDRGIIMIRRRFMDDIKAIQRGEEPKAVYRDPAQNDCIDLPIANKEKYKTGITREEFLAQARQSAALFIPPGYIFQQGQPDAVRREYEAAMGIAD